jgi:hypothetical protein
VVVGDVGVVEEYPDLLSSESLGIVETYSMIGDLTGVICDAGRFLVRKSSAPRTQSPPPPILW